MIAKNPIIAGFHPDPSICRVGEDFYLVNSSFAYFPGVPIFHSRDLVHWKQIGNVLNRNTQLDLEGVEPSGGIFAPTIRYYNKKFYVITTNVSHKGNFIVTATKPEGPWSEPYYLGEKEAKGIDPSLFFDEDGSCYYVGARENQDGQEYDGDGEIWAQKLDLISMKLIGPIHILWKGALYEAKWPEGPHLYKKNDWYYLMIAEGGTGINHSVTIARSREVFGPYEANPKNPILTHRHLGKDYPIINVGHGDMVDDEYGNWYMVMLGSRPCEGYTILGRETFLAKVFWEDDWPVVNKGIGKLEDEVVVLLPEQGTLDEEYTIEFKKGKLDPRLITLRNPSSDCYPFIQKEGHLRLYARKETLRENKPVSYLGIRQQHFNYCFSSSMCFQPDSREVEAGIAIVQNNQYHVRFTINKYESKGCLKVTIIKKDEETVIKKCDVALGNIMLKIVGNGQKASFYYQQEAEEILLVDKLSVKFLSTEIAGGFVGCTVGGYISSNGCSTDDYMDVEWMKYQPL